MLSFDTPAPAPAITAALQEQRRNFCASTRREWTCIAPCGGGSNVSADLGLSASSLQILRLPQVCKVTGLRRSMIYQLEAEQRFPNRIKIGIRAVGWIESEVQVWVARRIAASRSDIKLSV
jgi:prophage regulatory protein